MFFNNSVDSIVKQFTKMTAQLESLVSDHHNVIAVNYQAIDKLSTDNAVRKVEIDRARKIISNINSTISL